MLDEPIVLVLSPSGTILLLTAVKSAPTSLPSANLNDVAVTIPVTSIPDSLEVTTDPTVV